ncbi:MAG: trypsin-like peptidase domain-containing protein [Bryobacteraceae bacterium]|jgi:S1-C subfamily serine protease
MSSSLVTLSDEFAAVVERASKYVVSVHGHPRLPSSGVIWKPGVIVTAEHSIRRDDEIRVTLRDGKPATARLAGRDAGTDLAVLKIEDSSGPAADVHPGVPKAGEIALAVGRTQNTGVSAVMGVISGVGGPWNTWRGGRLDRFIRLDLRLYPGLSGGAIVNAAGECIGIGTTGLSRSSPLAIAAETISRVANELMEKGHVARGYLGVGLQRIALPEHLKASLNLADSRGLIALSVEHEGPAGKAGMLIGDILVAIDSKPMRDTDDVQAVLGSEFVGKTVTASIVRGGVLKQMPVVVGERPGGRP